MPSAREQADETRRLWRIAGLGGTLASEIIAGVGIGWLADYLLGTKPVLLVVFTVAGVLIGMISFIRSALNENKKSIAAARRHGLPAALPDPEPKPDDDPGPDD